MINATFHSNYFSKDLSFNNDFKSNEKYKVNSFCIFKLLFRRE